MELPARYCTIWNAASNAQNTDDIAKLVSDITNSATGTNFYIRIRQFNAEPKDCILYINLKIIKKRLL